MMGSSQHITAPVSPFNALKWCVYATVPAILWAGVNFQTLREYFEADATLRQNQAEVARLESEYEALKHERAMLSLGGFPAEKAIRERFKMVLPGEGVIFIQEDSQGAAQATPSTPWNDSTTTRSATLRSRPSD